MWCVSNVIYSIQCSFFDLLNPRGRGLQTQHPCTESEQYKCAELRGDFLILHHIAAPRCFNTSPEYFSAHSPRCGTDRRTFSTIIPVKGASVVGGWWLWREIKSITKHQYRNYVCYSRFDGGFINRNGMEMKSKLKLGANMWSEYGKWVWCCSGSFLDILCMESLGHGGMRWRGINVGTMPHSIAISHSTVPHTGLPLVLVPTFCNWEQEKYYGCLTCGKVYLARKNWIERTICSLNIEQCSFEKIPHRGCCDTSG